MNVVKVKTKYQVTLPTSIRKQAGLKVGDFLEARVEKGKVTLEPQSFIDRRLAEAMEDIKAGRTYGPFDSTEDMISDMKKRVKQLRNKK